MFGTRLNHDQFESINREIEWFIDCRDYSNFFFFVLFGGKLSEEKKNLL